MKNQHWSEINEATSVLGIRFLFLVYRVLGRGVFHLFVAPVILYYFCFQGRARRASRDYLQRVQAMKGIPDGRSLKRANLKHFFSFGSGLLDKLAAWSGGIRPAHVEYCRRDEFLSEVESGQGCLVIASHLGNLEVSRMLADSHKRVKLNILVHTKHAEKFNRLLQEVDEASCLNLIQVTEVTPATAVMLNGKIEAGEVVVIAGDRTPIGSSERASEVEFLGDRALLPQGPYILASILRCPVYTIFCVRAESGYQVFIEPFAQQIRLSRKERERELQQWAQRFADRLADYVLRFPFQWFNFYDFWWRPDNPEHGPARGAGEQQSTTGSSPASAVRH
ncbi:LpxL/LpxP family acyltransferase [Gilvimarinus sp. F26214L]|uniref:LpxL/LpxP family acyltransferase n=1 Tax=Gilvimarinus sp. DZF01 TaxID=3461371 RepID=UPI0040465B69